MSQLNDLSRSPTPLQQDSTIIAVIEMSQSSWLVAGIVPGIERHPLKKLEPSEEELIHLLMRWRAEATKHGRTIIGEYGRRRNASGSMSLEFHTCRLARSTRFLHLCSAVQCRLLAVRPEGANHQWRRVPPG